MENTFRISVSVRYTHKLTESKVHICSIYFLARLYESTGRAIAVSVSTSMSALLKMLKVFGF